jgi:hypothetical protein
MLRPKTLSDYYNPFTVEPAAIDYSTEEKAINTIIRKLPSRILVFFIITPITEYECLPMLF